jgi:hypothetical protein
MKTGKLEFHRGIYVLNKRNSSNNVWHFDLVNRDLLNICNLFTDIIKIEKDNGFHDRSRSFENWLYLRTTKNWNTGIKTGLAKTNLNNIYEGNISMRLDLKTLSPKGKQLENPQHFVIAQTFNDFKMVSLDLFPDFYPVFKRTRTAFLNEHKYLYK